MRSAFTSRRQAEARFDVLDVDEDVFAVQEERAMRVERNETARLLEEVDRELLAERAAEAVRLFRDFTAQDLARRARRRGEREVLRSLPTRLSREEFGSGEAA